MPTRPQRTSRPPTPRALIASLMLLLGGGLLTGCQALLFGTLNATAGHTDVVATRNVVFDPAHQLVVAAGHRALFAVFEHVGALTAFLSHQNSDSPIFTRSVVEEGQIAFGGGLCHEDSFWTFGRAVG